MRHALEGVAMVHYEQYASHFSLKSISLAAMSSTGLLFASDWGWISAVTATCCVLLFSSSVTFWVSAVTAAVSCDISLLKAVVGVFFTGVGIRGTWVFTVG